MEESERGLEEGNIRPLSSFESASRALGWRFSGTYKHLALGTFVCEVHIEGRTSHLYERLDFSSAVTEKLTTSSNQFVLAFFSRALNSVIVLLYMSTLCQAVKVLLSGKGMITPYLPTQLFETVFLLLCLNVSKVMN